MALTRVIPSYLYQQYADDADLQAFVAAFNAAAQGMLDDMNALALPVYTGLSGSLLDWVAQGLYGLARPVLSAGPMTTPGTLNAWTFNSIPLNQELVDYSQDLYSTSDDAFKRILTWHFYKGDGRTFSVPWLKRRVMRFLTGQDGTDPGVNQTYPVSVGFSGRQVTIRLLQYFALANVLQEGVSSGALELPFQYQFTVTT